MSNQPPPLPPTQPSSIPYAAPGAPPPQAPNAKSDYQTVADTVGFVPSMRKGESKLQGLIFLAALVVGFLVATPVIHFDARAAWGQAAIGGGVAGFVLGFVGVVASGAVLAVVNLFRAGKR